MNLLRNALVAVLLAAMSLSGWAAVGVPAATRSTAAGCCTAGHGSPMAAAGLLPQAGAHAAPCGHPARQGCSAAGQGACHAPGCLTLATAAVPALIFPVPRAAPVPRPDGGRVPAAPGEAPYRPPRAGSFVS